MSAKEYLQQAERIDRLIKSKTDQLARLEALATSATPRYSDTGASVSHDDSKGSKLENQVIGIVELKDNIRKRANELIKVRAEIAKTIDAINSLTHQYILEERYLNYKSWEVIGDDTGFSKDYLYRLHRDALRLVEAVLANK